jgi:hypothetical protein
MPQCLGAIRLLCYRSFVEALRCQITVQQRNLTASGNELSSVSFDALVNVNGVLGGAFDRYRLHLLAADSASNRNWQSFR